MFDGDSSFESIATHKEGNYLYIWGTTGGGFGGVKLARVEITNPDSLLDKSNYQFCTGGNHWSYQENDAVDIVPAPNREIGVVYNEYLGKYLLTTLDNISYDIMIRESSTPYGPWSSPILLYGRQYVNEVNQRDVTGMYGVFSIPGFMENEGETMYSTLNLWDPYNLYWCKIHFVKN